MFGPEVILICPLIHELEIARHALNFAEFFLVDVLISPVLEEGYLPTLPPLMHRAQIGLAASLHLHYG